MRWTRKNLFLFEVQLLSLFLELRSHGSGPDLDVNLVTHGRRSSALPPAAQTNALLSADGINLLRSEGGRQNISVGLSEELFHAYFIDLFFLVVRNRWSGWLFVLRE